MAVGKAALRYAHKWITHGARLHEFGNQCALPLPVRLGGDAAQFPLGDGIVAPGRERKKQQLLLNVRRQIEQIDDLAYAGARYVAGPREFGVTADGAVAKHLIQAERQSHEPADARHTALNQGLGGDPLRVGDAQRDSSARDSDALDCDEQLLLILQANRELIAVSRPGDLLYVLAYVAAGAVRHDAIEIVSGQRLPNAVSVPALR